MLSSVDLSDPLCPVDLTWSLSPCFGFLGVFVVATAHCPLFTAHCSLLLDTCASSDSAPPAWALLYKMNSLSLLSSRVIGQSSLSSRTRHQRSRSQGDISPPDNPSTTNHHQRHRSYSQDTSRTSDVLEKESEDAPPQSENLDGTGDTGQHELVDEKTPLLHQVEKKGGTVSHGSSLRLIPRRVFNAIADTIRVILSTLAAPGVYVARCFRGDDGRYSILVPLRKLRRAWIRSSPTGTPSRSRTRTSRNRRPDSIKKIRGHLSRDSTLSSTTSESEEDQRRVKGKRRSSTTRSPSPGQAAEETPPRRSIRIKLHSDESLKRQKEQRRSQGAALGQPAQSHATLNPDSLKSPISPSVHKLTRYPHSPAPPRPLVPLRLPSYASSPANPKLPQKTLVLDLDETLIHSLAKGGRMSSGHMVEVKLSTPMVTTLTPGGPPTALGPQHPILYYVHKRPHCDDFLRKVCKWYNLVVFTASVQEYADPVIDWLEQERKFFQARYYRQHCTFRNGAYIKDLSSVEPDLSKVVILDNSPMSYIFHEGGFVICSVHSGKILHFPVSCG